MSGSLLGAPFLTGIAWMGITQLSVSPMLAAVILSVILILVFAAAALSSWWPARRVVRIDPMRRLAQM